MAEGGQHLLRAAPSATSRAAIVPLLCARCAWLSPRTTIIARSRRARSDLCHTCGGCTPRPCHLVHRRDSSALCDRIRRATQGGGVCSGHNRSRASEQSKHRSGGQPGTRPAQHSRVAGSVPASRPIPTFSGSAGSAAISLAKRACRPKATRSAWRAEAKTASASSPRASRQRNARPGGRWPRRRAGP
jgi:hypothetical protein